MWKKSLKWCVNKIEISVKRNQKENLELKSPLTEVKTSLEGFKSRFEQAQDVTKEITKYGKEKKTEGKSKEPLRLWGMSSGHQNKHFGGSWKREKRARRIFEEIMPVDFRSRWQCRQTWLASSHSHIKIWTKIQNDHWEPSDIELNEVWQLQN